MQVRSGGGRPILWDTSAVLIVTALMVLSATGAAPSTFAHEVNRKQVTADHTESNGRRPVITAHTPGMAVSRSLRDPAPLDTAIRMLLCLEAREAIRTREFSEQLLDWILSNAHRCTDDRLLVDTFGF